MAKIALKWITFVPVPSISLYYIVTKIFRHNIYDKTSNANPELMSKLAKIIAPYNFTGAILAIYALFQPSFVKDISIWEFIG